MGFKLQVLTWMSGSIHMMHLAAAAAMPSNTYSRFLAGRKGAMSSSMRDADLWRAPTHSSKSWTSSGSHTNRLLARLSRLKITLSSMFKRSALKLWPAIARNLHKCSLTLGLISSWSAYQSIPNSRQDSKHDDQMVGFEGKLQREFREQSNYFQIDTHAQESSPTREWL